MNFLPYVVGTFGGINAQATAFLGELGSLYELSNVGQKSGYWLANIKYKISLSVQKSLANSIIRRGDLRSNLLL